jgi:MFS family permease
VQDKTQAPLLRDRSFRWLLGGSVVSMLGDQFTLIALPWLVLTMTGDPFALGTALALIGVPRAIFILIGGALVDRYSPRRVLLLTKYINTALLGLLAMLVLNGGLQVWMVYALSLGIGVATAFSIPSSTALLPHVVRDDQLQAANGIMLGARQVTMFAGPLLAGMLIASSESAAGGTSTTGLGLAFLLDALTFVVSAGVLFRLTVRWEAAAARPDESRVLQSVIDGLLHCWNDGSLRICLIYWAAIGFFISGPMQVAIPVLAGQLQGASAFGILMAAHGAGTLAGMVWSGIKDKARIGGLGLTMLCIDSLVGALFIVLGAAHTTWQAATLLFAIGSLSGFLHVAVFTWMQRRVPPAMMGRAMSLFMFIFLGIAPLSAAIAGWLMRSIGPGQLFAISGGLMVGIVAVAFFASPIRRISERGEATSGDILPVAADH